MADGTITDDEIHELKALAEIEQMPLATLVSSHFHKLATALTGQALVDRLSDNKLTQAEWTALRDAAHRLGLDDDQLRKAVSVPARAFLQRTAEALNSNPAFAQQHEKAARWFSEQLTGDPHLVDALRQEIRQSRSPDAHKPATQPLTPDGAPACAEDMARPETSDGGILGLTLDDEMLKLLKAAQQPTPPPAERSPTAPAPWSNPLIVVVWGFLVLCAAPIAANANTPPVMAALTVLTAIGGPYVAYYWIGGLSKCHRCNQPYAQTRVGNDILGSTTRRETEVEQDTIRDNRGLAVGTIDRKVQVVNTYRRIRTHWKCKYCGLEWTTDSEEKCYDDD